MGNIKAININKSFGPVHVIKGVDFEIHDGEFVVFVGPSGCGKSTMLRLVAGLEEISSGTMKIDGQDVTHLRAQERNLAMVFQSYALYPHLNVRDNMSFGLRIAGKSRRERYQIVERVAKILQLEPLLDRKPAELSGGQRQRVAIGRAIAREPSAFLFDEPLSNLDAALRVSMRAEIAQLQKTLKKTMIYVTHDQVEAMTLADRIMVFMDGRIQQQGAPLELYERPQNLFVARFIGSPNMNILECRQSEKGVELKDGTMVAGRGIGAGAAHFGIRPEHVRLCEKGREDVSGKVVLAEHLGVDSFLLVKVPGIGTINVRVPGGTRANDGEKVHLKFNRRKIHLFDEMEQRIKIRPG